MPLPGLSLVAFMDEQDAVTYLRTQCVLDDLSDEALVYRWRSARARLGPPHNRVGDPGIQEIPLAHKGYLDDVRKNPRYAGTVAELKGAAFKLVEIAPLLAFQFHVHTDATRLPGLAILEPNTPLRRILEKCLPRYNPPKKPKFEVKDNVLEFTSDDINFQPIPNWIIGENKPDESMSATLVVARNSPFVQVARFDGRYYLKNGFHRAVQLGQAGIQFIPCIVGEAPTWDHVVGKGAIAFGRELLASSNPPTLGHFVEDEAYPITLPQRQRIIRISVSNEMPSVEE